ncbi:Ig-like domain-containing protein, partial [Tsuneonella sp. HG222]
MADVGSSTLDYGPVTVGGFVDGRLGDNSGGPNDDQDWYRVSLGLGTYTFLVNGAKNAADTVDSTLNLRDSMGAILSTNAVLSVNNSQIVYTITTPGFYFLDVASQGSGSGPRQGDYRLSVSQNPNVAPVLNTNKTPVLSSVLEDAGAPVGAVGTLVSSLVDYTTPVGGLDNVTDADGPVLGIAVVYLDLTSGSWYFSLNNGSSWFSEGIVGEGAARFLLADANTRIFFRPNANFSGTVSDAIAFKAWDGTAGSNGGMGNTLPSGGPTAFSISTDTANITVTAVNDAPSGANASDTTNDITTLVLDTADFNTGYTDPEGNAFTGVVITTLPAAAQGKLQLNNVDISAGQFVTLAQLSAGNLTFVPVAGQGGTSPTFTFQVRDNGGTANGGIDTDLTPNTFTVNIMVSN